MEIRLRRGTRASPALYKAVVDDLCEALGRAVETKDKPNAVHTHRDFCRGLVNGALHNKNVAATARIERDRHEAATAAAAGGDQGHSRARRGRTPSGEWYRKRAASVSLDEALAAMSEHVDIVYKKLKKAGALGKKLDACVDKTGSKRWDSKPGPELVRGTIRDDRRAYAEVYIVIHCVVAGERLVLGVLPVSAGDDNYRLVEALIRACQERRIRLGVIMLDREFFDTRVIKVLEDAGVTYLIPCPDHGYAHEAKKEFVAGKRERVSDAVITRDLNTSANYTIIMADKKKIDKKKDREPEDKIIAFCTNDPGIDVEMYARRWGGETGNRQFKMSRPRTRTVKQGPRVLYFVASLIGYNVWVMINALLYIESMMRIKNSPPLIELDSVLAILVDTLTGPAQGPGPPPEPPTG